MARADRVDLRKRNLHSMRRDEPRVLKMIRGDVNQNDEKYNSTDEVGLRAERSAREGERNLWLDGRFDDEGNLKMVA